MVTKSKRLYTTYNKLTDDNGKPTGRKYRNRFVYTSNKKVAEAKGRKDANDYNKNAKRTMVVFVGAEIANKTEKQKYYSWRNYLIKKGRMKKSQLHTNF